MKGIGWFVVGLGLMWITPHLWGYLERVRVATAPPNPDCVFNGYGMISPFTFIWTLVIIAATLVLVNTLLEARGTR